MARFYPVSGLLPASLCLLMGNLKANLNNNLKGQEDQAAELEWERLELEHRWTPRLQPRRCQVLGCAEGPGLALPPTPQVWASCSRVRGMQEAPSSSTSYLAKKYFNGFSHSLL